MAVAKSQRARACSVQAAPQRRDMLFIGLGAAAATAAPEAALAAEKMTLPVSQLSTFERSDQRNEVLVRATVEFKKVLTKDDAPKAFRLLFNDAATYDVSSKTGGMDGSVVLSSEEQNRPENKGLKELIGRIKQAKDVIDEGNAALGSEPLSWADTLVLAAKTAVKMEWRDIKIERAAVKTGGDVIEKQFGAAWDVKLGRIDNPQANSGRVPAPGADPEEVRTFLLKLGAKPGDGGAFAPKPPFWERPAFVVWPATQDDPAASEKALAAANSTFDGFLKKYNQSRATTTRTDYEVDFINYFTKLADLGAKYNPDAYLHSVTATRLQ